MHSGLILPWRELGFGPFDHELPDSTIEVVSDPFEAKYGVYEGQQCCYVRLHGKRQIMPVEGIRLGVRMSQTMRDAQTLVARRPPSVSEEQAKYTALYRAMERVWETFEAAYWGNDPGNEQTRRRAFARDFGSPS